MKIFILFLFVLKIQTECSNGCLSCNKGSCQFCNHSLGYYNNNLQFCNKVQVENCKRFIDGSCVQCEQNYLLIFDFEKSKDNCVEIQEPIENCMIYKNEKECEVCENQYFLDKITKKCVQFSKIIENCESYFYNKQNQLKCLYCEFGYLLSLDYNTCTKYKEDENCLLSSNFWCEQCNDGFFLRVTNNNILEKQPSNLKWIYEIFAQKFEPYRRSNIFHCEKKQKNCASYRKIKIDNQEKEVCQFCRRGYYLEQQDDELKCVEAEGVKNCQLYKGSNQCEYCNTGYYQANNICEKANLKISHCMYYLDNLTCQVCQIQYQLVSSDMEVVKQIENLNQIVQRLLKIENGEEYLSEYDSLYQQLVEILDDQKIQSLQFEYDLKLLFSNDSKIKTFHQNQILFEREKFHNVINQIKQYLKDDNKNLFYQYQCFKNRILYCAQYLYGNCIQCEMNYYKIDGQCQRIDEMEQIDFCKFYNSEKQCIECITGFLLYQNKCYRQVNYAQCGKLAYKETGVCLLCKKGHYYDNEQQKCVEFSNQNDKNCLVYQKISQEEKDLYNCVLCDEDYHMNNNQKCIYDEIGRQLRQIKNQTKVVVLQLIIKIFFQNQQLILPLF